MTDAKGATAADWFHFEFVLGLGGNLLPCVPAGPDVKVAKDSQLADKIGKIPSMFNRAGEAHGISGWQKRPILSNELQHWSQDPRLNICVRLGSISGVYAIDVDIDDARAHEAEAIVDEFMGALPIRERSNSQKMLMAFRIEGSPCLRKRKIKLNNTTRGPAIEFLGAGQQFVASGTHSSGARYIWRGGLPTELPLVTEEQLNRTLAALTGRFATEPSQATATIVSASDSLTSASHGPSSSSGTADSVLTTISDPDWQTLLAALKFMIPHAGDEQLWAEIGMALLSIRNCGKPVRQLWLDFSRKAPNWQQGAAEAWWEAHARE